MGLSITQILFTIVVVVAVWRVVGFLERRRRQVTPPPAAQPDRALELRACPACGAYVAAGERCPRCQD